MIETKPQRRKFLKTFFKERKQVGAVAPSSKFLVKKMCDKVDFKQARVIIELGPGTGVFTKEILKRANAETKIFVFELNDDFYEMLGTKYNDKRMILVNGSAEEMESVLKAHGIQKADAIISSLPLTVIPEPSKTNIVKSAHAVLEEKGVYVQYQYSLSAKKLIESFFGKLNMRFALINVPPAFIYIGTKRQ